MPPRSHNVHPGPPGERRSYPAQPGATGQPLAGLPLPLLPPLLKGPVAPVAQQKGPQQLSSRGANPIPSDTGCSSDHLGRVKGGLPFTSPFTGFLEAFCPGAMKQAASFFHQTSQRETTCTKNLDKHFLEETVRKLHRSLLGKTLEKKTAGSGRFGA